MKRAWKWVAGIAAVIVVLIVAAVAVVASLDLNQYRGMIAAKAEEALGRKLTIAGDISAKVSLAPTIAVEKVSLANVPGGSRPNMVEVRRVEIQLQVLPLLSGDIRLNHVFVDGLDAVLETDASGRGNWEFGKPGQAAASSSGSGEIPFVSEVEVRDLTLAFNDARSGQKLRLGLESLDIEADSPSSPLKIAIEGDYQGVDFEAKGTTGSIASLMANQPFHLKLEAKAAGATMNIDGRIVEPMKANGLDVAIAVKGDGLKATINNLAPIVPALKDAMPYEPGPYQVSVRVGGSPARLALSDLKLAMGRSDTIQIDASGSVADVAAVKGIKLDFSVKAVDTAALAKATGVSAPTIQGLAVSGRVGDGAQGRPTADLTVNWQLIDLATAAGAASDSKPAVPPAAQRAGGDRVIPSDPLPLEVLKTVDVKATVRGQRLIVSGITAENIEVDANLNQGKLDVRHFQANVSGGTVGGRLNLDASRPIPDLGVTLQVTGVDGGSFVKTAKISDWLQGCRVDVQSNLKGAWRSPAEIAAKLNGDFQATVGEGKIHSRAFNLLGADLSMEALRALPFMGDNSEFTPLSCGVVKVWIKDGTATAANGIAIETDKMNVVGSGTVDLKTEAIDLAVKPEAHEGLGIGFGRLAGLMRVRGTLAHPSVGIDEMGVAKEALSTGAAFATGGLSLLAQGLLSRAGPDATALSDSAGQGPESQGAGAGPAIGARAAASPEPRRHRLVHAQPRPWPRRGHRQIILGDA